MVQPAPGACMCSVLSCLIQPLLKSSWTGLTCMLHIHAWLLRTGPLAFRPKMLTSLAIHDICASYLMHNAGHQADHRCGSEGLQGARLLRQSPLQHHGAGGMDHHRLPGHVPCRGRFGEAQVTTASHCSQARAEPCTCTWAGSKHQCRGRCRARGTGSTGRGARYSGSSSGDCGGRGGSRAGVWEERVVWVGREEQGKRWGEQQQFRCSSSISSDREWYCRAGAGVRSWSCMPDHDRLLNGDGPAL